MDFLGFDNNTLMILFSFVVVIYNQNKLAKGLDRIEQRLIERK